MHPHPKSQSLVLSVLFFITILSSVANTAPTFMKSTVSKCNNLKCATTSSKGTPAGATSSGDDRLIENTELQMSLESLPTKRGVSADLNLSGNDQLTDIVSLAENTEIGMKVTTGDVLPAVSGTDSRRIAKSTSDECLAKKTAVLPTGPLSQALPDRAMCQWAYTTNKNESRLPKEMQYAKLGACPKCIDSAGNEMTDSHCELVYYQVHVSRKSGDEWVPGSYENVPVAAVCVKSLQ